MKTENITTIVRRHVAAALEQLVLLRASRSEVTHVTTEMVGALALLRCDKDHTITEAQKRYTTLRHITEQVGWLRTCTPTQRYFCVDTGNSSRIGRDFITTRKSVDLYGSKVYYLFDDELPATEPKLEVLSEAGELIVPPELSDLVDPTPLQDAINELTAQDLYKEPIPPYVDESAVFDRDTFEASKAMLETNPDVTAGLDAEGPFVPPQAQAEVERVRTEEIEKNLTPAQRSHYINLRISQRVVVTDGRARIAAQALVERGLARWADPIERRLLIPA